MIEKSELDARVQALKARLPYQFEGARLGLYLCAGWIDIFEKLCEDIDHALGEDKRGFHWDQVKEKYGSARFYFQLGEMVSDLRMDLHTEKGLFSKLVPGEDRPGSPKYSEDQLSLVKRLRKLSIDAEMETQHTCVVCGEAGDPDRSRPWLLVLCDEHKNQRAALVKEDKDLEGISLRFD